MARTKKYSDLTLRKDGIYEKIITINKVRYPFRSKDPEEVYQKISNFFTPSIKQFVEVADEWHEEHWQDIQTGTQTCYNPAFIRAKQEMDGWDIETVSSAMIEKHLKRLKNQGLGSKTVKTQKCVYNQIFNFAIVKGYLQFNPVGAVKLPSGLKSKKREAPEDDVVELIQNSTETAYWGLFATFLIYTGCRRGEALAMTFNDIDRDKKLISINKSLYYDHGKPKIKEPKTEAGIRKVPLLDALVPLLPPEPKSKENNVNLIFPQENGNLMSQNAYRRRWQHYCDDIGLLQKTPYTKIKNDRYGKPREYTCYRKKPLLTAHQLRHGYATCLYEAGIDVQVAKVLLGHSDIEVTQQIYTHIRNKKKASAIDQLNAFFSKNDSPNAQ